MNKKKLLLLLPALGLLLTACQGPNTQPGSSGQNPSSSDSSQESGVTGVEVDHETLELQAGQTAKLSASVKPISLEDRSVTWSSDNSEVASVDASGMVTAVAQGTAHIKATANADASKFAECTVTVTARMVTIPKLTVAEVLNATETLKLGANQKNAGGYYYFKGTVDGSTRGETSVSWAEGVTVKLESAGTDKYYVTFGEGANKKYFEMDDVHHFAVVNTPTAGREWSWNETYATVQRTISGQSDAKNNGTFLPGTYQTYTTISGCNLDQAASDFFFQFVYQTAPVAPTAITVSAPADKIYQGGTLQMEAELAPAAAEGKIVWSVTGDEKVTINQEGLLTAAADATLNAKVKVKAAYEKDASIFGEKEITIAEYINYGTLAAPLTIAEAKAVIDKFPAGSITNEKIFVKGFVATSHKAISKETRNDIWLTSDDGSEQKAFELYSVYADESLGEIAADALLGKEVIAEGWGTVYKGTYEFSNKNPEGSYDNGFVRAITNNTRTATSLTLDPAEAFEIMQGGDKPVTATLLPYGASGTVSFAVAPANQGVTYAEGKVKAAADATAGSYTLTATCGTLSKSVAFTVKTNEGGGNAETTITLAPADLSGAGMTSTAGAQTATKSGLTVAISNGLVNDTQIRVYKNATITFTAAKIKSIEFTCTANGAAQYGPGSFGELTGYTFEQAGPKGTWTGDSASVTLTASSNQVRITQIVITYTAA